MFTKLKIAAILALVATIGAAAVAESAFARTTQCWKCVGGYCCY